MSEHPKKGDRYRHPSYRGTWIVRSAGARYVTLYCSIPCLGSLRLSTADFVLSDWRLLP